MKKQLKLYINIIIAIALIGSTLLLLVEVAKRSYTPPRSYISPAEDSLRAVITAQDSIIAMLETSRKTELDTIYIDRIKYRDAEQLTLATPDSMQEKLFLKNYPSADSFSAVLSNPIPIPSIRLANVAFVRLGAQESENKHLWSITEKQGVAIEKLQEKAMTYNDLALAISLERDSCALDNGALMESLVEQDMIIERQAKWLKYGGLGVAGYILARVGVKLLF